METQQELPRLDHVRVLVLFGGERLFGQERATINVFRVLAAQGVKARFITSSRWGRREIQPELDRQGLEWTEAPYGYQWGKYLFSWRIIYLFANLYGLLATNWKFWREVWHWRPTHLYVANWFYYSYAALAIALVRKPMVYRAGDEIPTHTAVHRWLTRKLLARTSQMVCVSQYIRSRCAAGGMPIERTRVIYSYPPVRAAQECPPLPDVPKDAVLLLYMGQISEHKGVSLLLETVENMLARGQNIALWLAGDRSWDSENYFASVQKRAHAAGYQDRICFLGYLPNLQPVLERAEIHVCPSLFADPLPNVVNEAKQAGKPSVVFPVGGLPELIEHTVDGFVCRACTREALTEGLEFFCGDAARRQAAGQAARQSLAARFGPERFRREWTAVFQETNV